MDRYKRRPSGSGGRRYTLRDKAPAAAGSARRNGGSLSKNDKLNRDEVSPYKRRAERALVHNVETACERNHGHTFFLTLTCGVYRNGRFIKEPDRKTASARLNSLRRHLTEWLGIERAIVVPERHKDGGIHFHLFVVLPAVSGGRWDWEAYRRMKAARGSLRRSQGRYLAILAPDLGKLWAVLRKRLNAFGFGRHELVPTRENRGIARYLAKYLVKDNGVAESPGNTRYWGEWREHAGRAMNGYLAPRGWSWNSEGGRTHRLVLAELGRLLGIGPDDDWQGLFRRSFGKKWCYRLWKAWEACLTARDAQVFCDQIGELLGWEGRCQADPAFSNLVDVRAAC